MHLEFLASDELGGRYTLSPNFAIAARYLAAHLEGYGFRGAGDKGSFLQTFEVVSSRPDPAKSTLELTAGNKTSTFGLGDFFSRGGKSNAVPPSLITRNASNFRPVFFETNPFKISVFPSASSFENCAGSMFCCKMILPERNVHVFFGPVAFSQV